MALAHHLCMRLANDAVIAAGPRERRMLARVVLAKGSEMGLLGFGLADNHLHIESACDRCAAGKLAQAVGSGLKQRLRLDAPFVPAFIKPVEDARHLYATFRYVLRQPAHHRLDADPLREASNLPDLLGLRTLGAYTRANVRRHLPRIRGAELLELLGVHELAAADGPLDRLFEATLAATALPALAGSAPEVCAARAALVAVAAGRVRSEVLAGLLGVSCRTVSRLQAGSADPELTSAIRLQLGLMARLPAATASAESPFASERRACG